MGAKFPRSLVSRRSVLRKGAAAIGAGAASIVGGSSIDAQSIATGPAGNMAGRRFKAWVTRGFGPNSTTLQELKMLPIGGRQIVVRNHATQCCYSIVSRILGTQAPPNPNVPGSGGALPTPAQLANASRPAIQGHGGVGIVEAVGPAVRRVQVGDRVIVGVTPECGECYECIRGRADRCMVLADPAIPIAEMSDGTQVVQTTNIGGFSELMITLEDWVVPVYTKVPSVELAMLSCVGSTGLGTTMTLSPVESGSDVAVFGCGPVGLSAVQGARIMGAAHIIAIEPIKARRDLALKVGATVALDPNAEGTNLLERIRDLCKGGSANTFSGSRANAGNLRGPDFVIEAVGGDRQTPRVEQGPDPTGILPLQQAWQVCPGGGHICTTGINQIGNVSFPAGQWSNGSKTQHSSQWGGTHLKRDLPRYVRLIERGAYDAKALITASYPLERTLEAYQAVADRTTVTAMIVFS
jgi:S-(hydroxymethyl)glutathione dehydrogenase / alcohol dehydrogenase